MYAFNDGYTRCDAVFQWFAWFQCVKTALFIASVAAASPYLRLINKRRRCEGIILLILTPCGFLYYDLFNGFLWFLLTRELIPTLYVCVCVLWEFGDGRWTLTSQFNHYWGCVVLCCVCLVCVFLCCVCVGWLLILVNV